VTFLTAAGTVPAAALPWLDGPVTGAVTASFPEPWLVCFFAPLFALLEVGEEPFPYFGGIPERPGVGTPVNVLQPRPTVLNEPLRVVVPDGVELFFEHHGV
jgi:hypothetical protein